MYTTHKHKGSDVLRPFLKGVEKSTNAFFCLNNIFQTDEKIYNMIQDSNFRNKSGLSQVLSQSKMKIVNIQTSVKMKH